MFPTQFPYVVGTHVVPFRVDSLHASSTTIPTFAGTKLERDFFLHAVAKFGAIETGLVKQFMRYVIVDDKDFNILQCTTLEDVKSFLEKAERADMFKNPMAYVLSSWKFDRVKRYVDVVSVRELIPNPNLDPWPCNPYTMVSSCMCQYVFIYCLLINLLVECVCAGRIHGVEDFQPRRHRQ